MRREVLRSISVWTRRVKRTLRCRTSQHKRQNKHTFLEYHVYIYVHMYMFADIIYKSTDQGILGNQWKSIDIY